MLRTGQAALRGHDLYTGILLEHGNLTPDAKGRRTRCCNIEARNSMPGIRDRLARSSEETSVMEVERRGKSSTCKVVTLQLQRTMMI